jgi:hypothetical protein
MAKIVDKSAGFNIIYIIFAPGKKKLLKAGGVE